MTSDIEKPEDLTTEHLGYILSFQSHCDNYLRPIANPRGKSVLVIGSGKGTEMFWCIRHGAREVIGIDIRRYDARALELAIEQSEMEAEVSFEMVTLDAEEAESLGRRFDIVLSNNVFEHLPDIDKVLQVCANVIEPGVGRIAVFTDPLYYSSLGAHLSPVEPWEHLWGDLEEIRARVEDWEWKNFLKLNKMTLADFTAAIKKNGLKALQLETVPDRNLNVFDRYKEGIDPGIPITDLTSEGIAAELSH